MNRMFLFTRGRPHTVAALPSLLGLLALVGMLWCAGQAGAQERQTGQAPQAGMPSYANSRAGDARGVLKVCTKPVDCYVRINGQQLRKNTSVLTVDSLKPGVYDVIFESKGGTTMRRARIAAGQTTVVFASLDQLRPAGPGWQDPLKQQPEQKGATFSQQDPKANNVVEKGWNKVTGKKGPIAAAGTAKVAENPADLVDAEISFELAQLLQKQFNPFSAERRYDRSLELYRHIIEDFPNTPYVEMAHYYSGRIYESRHVKEYGRALTEYQTVLKLNPYTTTDAAKRVANLYGGPVVDDRGAPVASVEPLPPLEAGDGVLEDVNQPGPLTASTIGVTGGTGARASADVPVQPKSSTKVKTGRNAVPPLPR